MNVMNGYDGLDISCHRISLIKMRGGRIAYDCLAIQNLLPDRAVYRSIRNKVDRLRVRRPCEFIDPSIKIRQQIIFLLSRAVGEKEPEFIALIPRPLDR